MNEKTEAINVKPDKDTLIPERAHDSEDDLREIKRQIKRIADALENIAKEYRKRR